MLRNFLSVIASFATAWILFTFFDFVSYLVSPKPVGMDFGETTMVKEFMNGMPLYSWLIIIAGKAIGSIAAGYVIGKYAESPTKFFPLLAGAVLTAGWLVNIMNFPHPIWIVVIVFPLFIPTAVFGHRFALKSRAEVPKYEKTGLLKIRKTG